MNPDPSPAAEPSPASARNKIAASVLCLAAALLLFFSSSVRVPILDPGADRYFEEALTKAGLVYATCRVINASVSLIKDTTVQVQPAGVGMTLAVGQVLDPIDDLTERLSDIMVTAIVSLGIQKLAHEIFLSLTPLLLAILLVSASLLSWWPIPRLAPIQRFVTILMLLLLVARFCLPLAALANQALDRYFFSPRIDQARAELALASDELEKLKKFSFPETDGLLSAIGSSASFLKFKSEQFKNALVATVSKGGSIIENLLSLAALYVGIFLIQVVCLPLAIFWFLSRLASALLQAAVGARSPGGPSSRA